MANISKENIENALSSDLSRGDIFVFNEVDSTNNIAKQLASQGIGDKSMVVAGKQTNGRGRLGRSFLSNGNGVYMSVVIRPTVSADKILKITAGAAVAVKRVIEKYCNDVKIKWVNDIYISQKKACGILAEAVTGAEGKIDAVIVGIGVNVFGKSDDFGVELKNIVTTMEEQGGKMLDINRIVAQIYEHLITIYSMLDNFYDVIAEYKDASLVVGKEVYMIHAGEKRKIMVTDIDMSGAIVARDCETNKEIRVSTGEVSIRFE